MEENIGIDEIVIERLRQVNGSKSLKMQIFSLKFHPENIQVESIVEWRVFAGISEFLMRKHLFKEFLPSLHFSLISYVY